MRSCWWGRLFWLALIAVLIVPSSAAPEPVHRAVATRVPPYPLAVMFLNGPSVALAAPGLPACRGSEDDGFSCLRMGNGVPRRATVKPYDAEAAQAEATTVKWLLTNTDSRTAKLPATADEVRQRLLRAGYRQAVARTARLYDPALIGSVVHAVPVGTACLIGYQFTWDHVDADYVMGTLPDGSCL